MSEKINNEVKYIFLSVEIPMNKEIMSKKIEIIQDTIIPKPVGNPGGTPG